MKRSLSQPNIVLHTKPDNSIEQSGRLDHSVINIGYLNPMCSICQNVLLFPCTLGCGHSFCYCCLKNLHKHVHSGGGDDDDDEDDTNANVPHPPVQKVSAAQTYKTAFFNNQCFKSVMGGKCKTNFSSDLLLDKDRLMTHILQDSVFCDNCPYLKCPTCRLHVKVMPKPNILLHESLKQLLGQLYETRVEEYLSNYSQNLIIEEYEKSERYKTIEMLVTESIESIKQAVTFTNLMESFSMYADIEIAWCLSKLLKKGSIVIVNDIIISNMYYSSDFHKMLTNQNQNLSSDDINYLIVSHPAFSLGNGQNTQTLMDTLKKRFKGVRSGILSLIDNEEQFQQSMRECVANNGLLNW